MRLYIGVTDNDWFALHAGKQSVDEVNFWRPSPYATFKALQPGEILLFKLHSPNTYITGGGFFTRFLQLPLNLAWGAIGEANGVQSPPEMRGALGSIGGHPSVQLTTPPSAASCSPSHSSGRGSLDPVPGGLLVKHRRQ